MALHKKDNKKRKLEKRKHMFPKKLFSRKAILLIVSIVVHRKNKKTIREN